MINNYIEEINKGIMISLQKMKTKDMQILFLILQEIYYMR